MSAARYRVDATDARQGWTIADSIAIGGPEASFDNRDEVPRSILIAELLRLADDIAALKARVGLAMGFQVGKRPNDLYVLRRGWGDGAVWCVSQGPTLPAPVLTTTGEWEYEPLPSERTEGFIRKTRFSLDEAMQRCDAANALVTR